MGSSLLGVLEIACKCIDQILESRLAIDQVLLWLDGVSCCWQAALCTLVVVPLISAIGIVDTKMMNEISTVKVMHLSEATSMVKQTISQVKTVFAFVGENSVIKLFVERLDKQFKLELRKKPKPRQSQSRYRVALLVVLPRTATLLLFILPKFALPLLVRHPHKLVISLELLSASYSSASKHAGCTIAVLLPKSWWFASAIASGLLDICLPTRDSPPSWPN
ncbi:hypothetical protein Syun_020574 [Stephania yunnanensis]|uniref:ABC transmembrane type-1 domain-containing protein n=1 Tax=Stephania yunnanensis TaxID=152371 RepID=A0AAP0IFZ1_9MAGN